MGVSEGQRLAKLLADRNNTYKAYVKGYIHTP